MEPNTDEFIDRSFVAEGTKVHVLSPEDNLLQVCVHTAKHSYCRAPGLRLHMDVDRIVAHNVINWNTFLDRVRDCHVCTSTYLSLYIPTILFGTNIPSWVLNELSTPKAEKILNALANVSLIHPKEKKFSKIQFLRFQTMLYDSQIDIIHTIYPGREWINTRYGCKTDIQVLKAVMIRSLDLIGIRKKK